MKKSLLIALFLLLAASAVWVIQRRPSMGRVGVPVETMSGGVAAVVNAARPDAILERVAPGSTEERAPVQSDSGATTSLVVTVLGAGGEPIVDGSVVATREAADGSPSFHSVASISSSGVASFMDAIPGRYLVQDTVSMTRKRVEVELGAETAMTLVQESDPLFRVIGKVVDPDGHPVSGATIWSKSAGPFLPGATTRADGSFHIQLSAYSALQASVPERLPSGLVGASDLDGDSRMGRSCTLILGAAAARITGRVVAANGTSISGALVTAGSLNRVGFQGSIFGTPMPVTVITDEEGRFEYGHALPDGTWRIGALAPDGRGVVRMIDVAGSDLEVLLTVQPGATIEGVVLGVDGKPAVGAQVLVRPIRDETVSFRDDASGILGYEHHAAIGAEGAYRLVGVLGLEIDLEARTAYGEPLAKARVELAPLLSGETRRIDFKLSDEPVLAGVVVDESGLPLQGVRIDAEQRMGEDYREFAQTDAAGRFRLTSVPTRAGAADSWTIEARVPWRGGSEILGSVSGVPLGTEDITIVATQPTPVDAFLSGHVVFAGDELPANVEVTLTRIYDPEPTIRSGTFIDVDRKSGRFLHGPVAAGRYRITARQNDEELGVVEGIVVGAGETIVAPDLTID